MMSSTVNNAQSDNENSVFQVLNADSPSSRMYSLNTPFQITYEFISGNTSEDYMNAVTLSEKGSYFCREQADLHNENYYRIPSHSHDYYEMMIVLEGSVIVAIEDNIYTYDAGSVCFLNRNLSHKEQFQGSCRLLFLGFSVTYLNNLFDKVKKNGYSQETAFMDTRLARFIRHDMQHSGEKVHLDFLPTRRLNSSAQMIHEQTEQLMKILLKPEFGASFLVDGLICSIFSVLANAENYHCTTVELAAEGDHLLFMRIGHLLEESDGRMTRTDLSEALHYSGDYISRIVKKYSGLTLHEYSLKFLLRKAAYLLIHTKDPITAILNDLGFSNRTYFYKVFQQQYGMTPKEYRKQGA